MNEEVFILAGVRTILLFIAVSVAHLLNCTSIKFSEVEWKSADNAVYIYLQRSRNPLPPPETAPTEHHIADGRNRFRNGHFISFRPIIHIVLWPGKGRM